MKTSFANASRHRSLFISPSFLSDRLPRKNRQSTGRAHSSWLSRTKSRDYHAPSPRLEKELRGSCATPPRPFLPFAFLHPLSRPSWPLPSFYFESRDPLSTADSRTARKPAVFIYGIETPPFCIFITLSRLGAGFCAYCVVDPILSFAGQYLSSERKRRYREKEQAFLARGPVHARFFFRPILQRGYI